MHPSVPHLLRIFDGYTKAHGVYQIEESYADGEKVKGKAFTVKADVTGQLWEDHLSGKQGLGIIPINENNQVKFGAIDIDDYAGFDHAKLCKQVSQANLPLIVCRTKSGGAHLYLFMKDWTSAKLVQSCLQEIAAYLGYGGCEIFPKQTEVLTERGDLGQWINMPYFHEERTMRYAVKETGDAMSLGEFFDLIDEKKTTIEFLKTLKLEQSDTLPEGPPCLQLLAKQGFPKGTRNNGLMNLAVYCKKRWPDDWKTQLERLNNEYMDPPLPSTEVLGIVKSVDKKDYKYTCSQEPIKSFCNSSKCRGRKFGVGGGYGMPKMGTLTKLDTSPPIWFLDVEEGGRMELATEDLQSPNRFQKCCMDVLNMMPKIATRDDWQEIVSGLLENLNVIEVPRESSPEGQLIEFLESFCTGRVQGKEFSDMLVGKPFLHDGKHYFRLRDFKAFLDRNKFFDCKTNKITATIRDAGGTHHFMNLKGKGVNCWSIPRFDFQKDKLTVPLNPEAPY